MPDFDREVHSFQDELPPYDRSILVYDTRLVLDSEDAVGWRITHFSSVLGFDYYDIKKYTHWCELPDDPT